MRVIEIQAPGLLTTVQDIGREGFGPWGVSPSGAADSVCLRLGNRLVGNVQGAAGVEMTLFGGTFHFPQGAIVSLTGSDFGATLNDAAIDLWTSHKILPGQTLRLGPTRSGARCYLCVQGGIEVKPFLGSASTHVLTGLGGFSGRALRKGDVLKIGPAETPYLRRTIAPHLRAELGRSDALRVTAGPQVDWFSEASRHAFYTSAYRVGEESNRMGLRLEGVPVRGAGAGPMITEGVSLGAVQVPPEGLPIILFVEQQTTGGYPTIANVISSDLHHVGQLRPRDEIRFEQVSFETARSLLVQQESLLTSEGSVLV